MRNKLSAGLTGGLVAVACLVFVGLVAFLPKNAPLASTVSISGAKQPAQEKVGKTQTHPSPEHIHGQVIYQQRIALPPQALLLVQLVDVTHPDRPQEVVVEQRLALDDEVPVSFSLPLTLQELPKENLYALKAQISVGDSLWFVHNPPLALETDKSAYLLRLEMVAQNATNAPVKTGIEGRQWIADYIDGIAALDGVVVDMMIEDDIAALPNSATAGDKPFERHSVTGSGGCNRYFSTALLDSQAHLHFEPIGMTFMLCEEAISHQENRFVAMMAKVHRYLIDNSDHLYLMDENNQTIARFSTKD